MAQYRKDTYQYLADGKTIFEVVMMADQYGNLVGPANPSGMSVDAFGRARVSEPFTLFDGFNRYQLSDDFNTSNTATATFEFSNTDNASVDLTVDTTDGAHVYRETKKVFAYQPGKSLQIFNTFSFNQPKTNLRQRVGYFSVEDGIYLEQDDSDVYFVKRSTSSGSTTNTRIAQTSWNVDQLDGNGPSGKTLDLTKSQIMFSDIEWLGLGTVRVGFVIDGQLIHCHSFHHANLVTAPYMQTACLPVRLEIENTGTTSTQSTLKQVCSSVMSEGGYQLNGKPRSVGNGILTANLKDAPTAGTFVPVVAIRLKSDRLDAIVVPKDISFLAVGNNTRAAYRIYNGNVTLGGNTTFVSAGSDSNVEYNLTANTISGGNILKEGYVGVTNQSVSK